MQSASMEMSGGARSGSDASHAELDELVNKLADKARSFARMPVPEKSALLRSCIQPLLDTSRAWVEAGAEAKGLSMDEPASGEEWLAGPVTTMRNIRLLAESLDTIAKKGKPPLGHGKLGSTYDGASLVSVFPTDTYDSLLFAGFTADVRMQKDWSVEKLRERQASFYDRKDPEGGVALVLGAGNVASIPPMDALYKLFVDGEVCLVKMNPVNEYLLPFFERALAPLVDRGFLAFVTGGADVGQYLTFHKSVTSVHITGSDRTHDILVWGPPGAERDRRMAEDNPLLKKPITSELGSVTPVVIVPGNFTDKELRFVGEHIAAMVANNASCNCNAAKMLVTQRGWAQRDALLRYVRESLARVPSRKAYYPGAAQRFEHLVGGREGVVKLGVTDKTHLPWALVFGLDGADRGERLFSTEPFCPILSEATLEASDAAGFLDAAVRFCNDTLWGTLSASIFIHPTAASEPSTGAALERALQYLRYGAVCVNQWAGLVYGTVSPPWGAHPSSTPKNIQGGLGWVHNTFMLEGIEKVVLRGPLTMAPKPAWFASNRKTHLIAQRTLEMEAAPSPLKLPRLIGTALQG